VLINIAINAGDAMPNGGTLTFSARTEVVARGEVKHRLSAGTYIRLSVEDTGAGMDATTLARVTEPFFTTKPVGKGTGLGLSMASTFAEQTDGAMTIVSAPGLGTTVTLLLPSTDVGAVVTSPSRDVTRVTSSFEKPRILLVDDEAPVRNVIAELLEEAGYSVTQADDSVSALDVLKTGEKVDLLLSDLSMPGLDGISLIRASQRQRPGLPAILLTGYLADVSSIASNDSFSLLRKPISGTLLTGHISSLLRMDGVGPQLT
jgi:CheY-like chemotaxis protein/anti-sigma regulatory factor (Ser/Thr protein kinase)